MGGLYRLHHHRICLWYSGGQFHLHTIGIVEVDGIAIPVIGFKGGNTGLGQTLFEQQDRFLAIDRQCDMVGKRVDVSEFIDRL